MKNKNKVTITEKNILEIFNKVKKSLQEQKIRQNYIPVSVCSYIYNVLMYCGGNLKIANKVLEKELGYKLKIINVRLKTNKPI